MQDDFSAAKSYLEFLSAEINSTSEQSTALKKASAESKLAEYLLSRPRNSKGEVSLPQDILKLAKQLELDRNTLFKAIEALNAELEKIKGVTVLAEEVKPKKAAAKKPAAKKTKKAEEPKAE
mgnify:CR=1 FL=1